MGLSLLVALLSWQAVSEVLDLFVALVEVLHVLNVILLFVFGTFLFLLVLVVELADAILFLAVLLFGLLVRVLQLVLLAALVLELARSFAENFVVVSLGIVEDLVVRRLAQTFEQLLLDGFLQLSSLESLSFSSFLALFDLCVCGDNLWSVGRKKMRKEEKENRMDTTRYLAFSFNFLIRINI